MITVGRLCVKIAGHEAGLKCVVLDVIDQNFVLIDGQVKRRKCNIQHLEPLDKIIKIKKNASHEDVVKEFKKLNIEIKEIKEKKKKEKPKKQRKIKKQEPKEIKKRKEVKKEKPKEKEKKIKK